MKNILLKFLKKSYLSRWIVLIIDMTIIATAFVFTNLLYYVIIDRPYNFENVLLQMIFGIPFVVAAAYFFKPHHGIIRHTALQDALALAKAHAMLTSGLFLLTFAGSLLFSFLRIHWAVIVTHYFISIFALIAFRLLVHYFYIQLIGPVHKKKNILIYGAGRMGVITHNVIRNDHALNINIVAFVDDNPQLHNRYVGGAKVLPPSVAFNGFASKNGVKEVILAIAPAALSPGKKREILELCYNQKLKVAEVPAPGSWINGNFRLDQIQAVRIEDLLGRDVINLNCEKVGKAIYGKQVMVTGAAGSIGSEIVRQVLRFEPQTMILVDIAESALFDLHQDIKNEAGKTEIHLLVASVSDEVGMRRIFSQFSPHIIYHASAYKHVPLMEEQPYEAIRNNVKGAKVVADLAMEFGVVNFVMVSTDKAVNPTNVMGASKRLCEIYVQSLSVLPNIKTHFVTTRFGNVLGSSGSVIPLFKKQIAKGGPVTITHRDIIRFFMTIPEAASLVIEAGFMGKGGEIFVFDMGQPVSIYNLAEKMITLAGFVPNQDIEIKETGLRPGEKLYEELLADKETTRPTHHEKILIANIRAKNYNVAMEQINNLVNNLASLDDMEIVKQMKHILPYFISQNSKFCVLDAEKKALIN